jgi:hypothetical protein
MKKLRIVGMNGVILLEIWVNLKGDDFVYSFTNPVVHPIQAISISGEVTENVGDKELESFMEVICNASY